MQEYWQLRDAVVAHEHVLLRTLGFELTFEHPYKYALQYVKSLKLQRNFAQMAWNIVHDR